MRPECTGSAGERATRPRRVSCVSASSSASLRETPGAVEEVLAEALRRNAEAHTTHHNPFLPSILRVWHNAQFGISQFL